MRALKRAFNVLGLVLVAPAGATARVEGALRPESHLIFSFWAHLLALSPGLPGVFLRRAYYRWTLDGCSEDAHIEFGTVVTRRQAIIGEGVIVGAYALIGSARINERSLIGSRASLLSGGRQHELLPSGRWGPTDERRLQQIHVGPDAWVGEGCILMADVGAGCMIAAGAVVSSAVPNGIMVAGNPARFVRHVGADARAHGVADASVPSAIP